MWNIHLIKIEKLKLFISLSFSLCCLKSCNYFNGFLIFRPRQQQRRSQSSTFSLLFMVVQVWISAFDFWVRTGSFLVSIIMNSAGDFLGHAIRSPRSSPRRLEFRNWQLQTTDGRAARKNEIFSIDKNQGSESRAKNKMRRKEITRISKSPSVQTV